MVASLDAISFLELASRCRRLADGGWDEATKAKLLTLAAKYEARAVVITPADAVFPSVTPRPVVRPAAWFSRQAETARPPRSGARDQSHARAPPPLPAHIARSNSPYSEFGGGQSAASPEAGDTPPAGCTSVL